jgi:hypothetical protein
MTVATPLFSTLSSGSATRVRSSTLFDHLVGAGEQRGRDGEAERLGGRQVDYEIERGRLLDWDFAPPGSLRKSMM